MVIFSLARLLWIMFLFSHPPARRVVSLRSFRELKSFECFLPSALCVFLALIHKQISSALELSALATNAVHPRTHLTIMSDLLGLYIFFFIFLSVVIFLCEIWIHSSAQLCAPSFRKKLFFRFTRLPASAIRLSYRRLACEIRKTHTHFFPSLVVCLLLAQSVRRKIESHRLVARRLALSTQEVEKKRKKV